MSEKLVVSVPDDGLLDALDPTPGAEFVKWGLRGPAPRTDIDIVTVPYTAEPQILADLRSVGTRLIQSQSIGFDGMAELIPAGIPFANAASVHEAPTAELAVGLAIAMQRGIPDAVRDADKRIWAPQFRPALADQRVLLVGYGGVSKAIEARLLPFEVELTRVARTARADRDLAGNQVQVHGIDELHALLGRSDIVVVALPLNEHTKALFDAEAIAAMPEGALLINVGRGAVVDTDALVAALQAGLIRAGLDVVDPEPLPADHPLWDCPNLLITPHNGGDTFAMQPRMAALLRRQISRMQAGEPPLNVVL